MGAVLGERFLIVERIGHGASGTIYRGEHITLRRKVAIKVLHQELARDELAVERFRREATTVSEIDNDHIVEIHDFGRTHDGRLYLAMELLEGETLQERLRRDRCLAVELAVDVLIQLGEGLMEAHAMGYVHRDLRPRNVYLTVRRGRADFVKLLDFGLAKLVEEGGEAESTSLGMTFGDPKYMAPEQARGEPLDRRADIYSLGCIAYEMLVGQPPFAGGKAFDILARHVDSVPPEPRERRPDVPMWLNAAIVRMLAKRPEDRFTTVYRVVDALRHGLETGQIMPAEVPESARADSEGSGERGGEPALMAGRTIRLGVVAPAPAAVKSVDATVQVSLPPVADVLQSAPTQRAAASPDAGVQRGGQKVALTRQVAVPPVVSEQPVREDRAHDDLDRAETVPRSDAEIEPLRAAEPAGREESVRREDAPERRGEGDERRGGGGGARDEGEPARGRPEDSLAGLSQAWFADGEGESGEIDQRQRARLDRARDNVSRSRVSDDDDVYYEPDRKPMVKIAVVAGVVLVLIVVLALAWPSGRKKAEPQGKAEDTRASAASALAKLDGVDAAPATAPVPAPIDAGAADATPVVAITPADSGVKPAGSGVKPAGSGAKPAGSRPDGRDRPSGSRPGGGGSGASGASGGGGSGAGGAGGGGDLADELRDPFGDEPAGGGGEGDGGSSQAANQAKIYAMAGQAALRNGDTGSAADNFKKALEKDARNVDAIVGLGEIALQTGSYGAAISHLKKAARMSSKNAYVHTLLGEAYLNSGSDSQAAASFKQALKLDPDSTRARNGYNEAAGRIPPPPEDP